VPASKEEQRTDLLVSCSGSIPDCRNLQTAFDRLASPSKTHEWCSNDFSKFKITLDESITEPLKEGDTFSINIAGLLKSSALVTQSGETEKGIFVYEVVGSALLGIIKNRFRSTLFKDDNGVIMLQTQVVFLYGGLFLVNSKDHVMQQHQLMIKEFNESWV
jgi:hypothetical protein